MTAWVRIGAVLGTALLASGCVQIQGHRGYLADEILLQSVQPGVDDRQSVERTLGRPSFVGQFGEPVWYYVSSSTMQTPTMRPKISGQTVLAVHFDGNDQVVNVERTGMELVARIDPESEETPTLGRERSFFEDLFGNIGQVGTGAGAGAGGGGGGR
jgi:outer membrane protein assembly factor BamE (lipoprotein component of BamABCDE complex)